MNKKDFNTSGTLWRVEELDDVLTAGRYVGLPEGEDEFNLAERFGALQGELLAQMEEEKVLNAAIVENLKKVKI